MGNNSHIKDVYDDMVIITECAKRVAKDSSVLVLCLEDVLDKRADEFNFLKDMHHMVSDAIDMYKDDNNFDNWMGFINEDK